MSGWLTPMEAADYLGVTPEKLADMAATRRPLFRGDGRDRLYCRASCDAYLAHLAEVQAEFRRGLGEREYLTNAEAAHYCGMVPGKLEEIRNGKGGGPRVSPSKDRKVMYHRADLDAWLASGGDRG